MPRVALCLIQDHDTRLVVIAVLVCLLATGTAMRLLDARRNVDDRRDSLRLGAAIVVFSSGVWTTHVVSTLAFRPDLTVGLDVQTCLLALGLAVVSAGVGLGIWPGAHGSVGQAALSGGVLAVGTAAIPLTVLLSATEPGPLSTVPSVLGLMACCTMAAMTLLFRRHGRWASVVLTLGIWLGHAVVMASLNVEGAGPMGIPVVDGARRLLAMLAAAMAVLAVGLALLATAIGQRINDRLARQAERFRMLTDATLEGLIFERHGQIASVNRAMCDLAETEAGGLVGRKLTELIPGIGLRLSERGHPVEHAVRLQGGRTVPVEISWQNGPDTGGHVFAVRDLSRQKFAEHQLEHLARLDPLTGLLNREQFEQVLHHALRSAAPNLAVFYIELDRFELIAETVGHRAAEQILVQTAQRLSSLKPEASVVARLSRDAFAVIQVFAGPAAEPAALADRTLGAVALPFRFDMQPIAMTASIGIGVYPQDAGDAPTLVECAMLALCQAKRDGAGQWRRFQANMDLMIQKKRSLTNDLRAALRQGQFSLNYQPIVETGTLGVVGYEALLRWDHPERGRIPPSDFIPLAEETGLIVAIGIWVLATACAEAVAWADPVVISVNLSPAQFIQPGIVDEVAKVLRQTGLPPHRLELEITESTLMDDTQNAVRILSALKALGVKLAMDDFGTGYSSLSYLRKFPFDKIKIDRSFINDATESTDAETIVQAIIAMSRSLRLRVTAEGVETRQQLAMLRALGCDFVQGYLLGYPRSANELDLRGVKTPQVAVAAPRLVTAVGVGMA